MSNTRLAVMLQVERDEERRKELLSLLEDLLDDPIGWLLTLNDGFKEVPLWLIANGHGDKVLARLNAIMYGCFS